MTPAGIEYDLEKSPFTQSETYGEKVIIFYFSSQRGLDHFKESKNKNREDINNSLSNRFKMRFKVSDAFCDVSLYRQIERRGYHIDINGDVVKWHNALVYDGQNLLIKSYQTK